MKWSERGFTSPLQEAKKKGGKKTRKCLKCDRPFVCTPAENFFLCCPCRNANKFELDEGLFLIPGSTHNSGRSRFAP